MVTDSGYFEMPGLDVLVFNNSYSEGHQGGIEIIQHGNRVSNNGNLRLDASGIMATGSRAWRGISKSGL